MKRVVVVDYGMCNLDSVARAVEECGGVPHISGEPAALAEATHVILPGVGAFADAMAQLRERGLVEPLRRTALDERVPFLGVCLGMQLMAEKGYEGGESAGLGLIAGEVRRLPPDSPHTRIPHVGWNEVEPATESPLFAGIDRGTDFYFVHSYHFCPAAPESVLARTPYCGGFVSAISGGGSLFGVQFHPEKSQKAGFRLLRNFLAQ